MTARSGGHRTLKFFLETLAPQQFFQPGQVKRLATRVAYLEGGRLVAEAPTDLFFNTPLPPEAASFLRGENPWL